MKIGTFTFSILLLMFLSACVSSSKFEDALAEKDAMRESLEGAQDEIGRNKAKIAKTEQELEAARMQNSLAQEEIARNQQQLSATEQELESAKIRVEEIQNELMNLEARKQALQRNLAESQEQMATLRNIEAETKRRNEIYAQFVNRLQTMIDGGQLTVSIEQGRIVINLPNNVLFNSGSANLNPAGKEALGQIATVLSQFSDRRFQIEGHTDNRPIKSARFPSNWELSTSRALTVVHLLTDMGVIPENISAAGFGEFRPRAENETDEGRQLNRRIEIIMMPNLDILSSELPKVSP
ncbi:MAG: OmpA family protein [Gammaproteobacteria bacterium]|nr:OmpA family protein [Gammaproteobacteria bacterium]MCF6363475.1 OmpA family protein [Gammaproteobacteria bacterium]